mgnify:FL=1
MNIFVAHFVWSESFLKVVNPNANHPRLSNVAMTTNVTPKPDNKNGKGNKNTNQMNMLILVRLKPLTDGNIGILANEYSSLLLIASA